MEISSYWYESFSLNAHFDGILVSPFPPFNRNSSHILRCLIITIKIKDSIKCDDDDVARKKKKIELRKVIKCTHEKSIKFDIDELPSSPRGGENWIKFKIVHHRQCHWYFIILLDLMWKHLKNWRKKKDENLMAIYVQWVLMLLVSLGYWRVLSGYCYWILLRRFWKDRKLLMWTQNWMLSDCSR